ncbi:saccharopine dehydrogenase NADP-binding domain-containing protein [Rickettsiales endosymbiont of Trichoplax sp. H2]|uniref:saccharopine dehydrogenase NADP-binding domain-containing protein n=1 Tax=Rickettsiales endosymbiont of Trichoplax sp. H2 TaxID=2021221 RepID=UPI0012B2453F|nr:saccharopine dehydrogenase NADP-binding domain-containing protein [Rickettsiales endosymbiont of Trichoplax sp. H2]MSO13411.1 hypothetical protein [Rickettsiales endosymbiont of Trichoplax sp. H2]
MNKILILGGYGNFGKIITEQLVRAGIDITIAGRNEEKAKKVAAELNVKEAIFDVNTSFDCYLKIIKPKIVINTCGPFQKADYSIAKSCIKQGVHYIDIADGRDFVCRIIELDKLAKQANTIVISGASTVPCLSSTVVEKFKNKFSQIDSLIYGITPGQRTPRGRSTLTSILTYLGKPLKSSFNSNKLVYGWQDIYRQKYPELGKRWMANCDVPDLDIFPKQYGIKVIKFSAGIESSFLHLSAWALSWLKRVGLSINLEKYADFLLKLSNFFNIFGTDNGGMHMIIKGKDKFNQVYERKWFLIAKNDSGIQIPCVPSVILAKKILSGELSEFGARPCIGMVKLQEYLNELSEFEIIQYIKN